MGEKIGATVTLETAPLKYDGLSYTEIWISEAQERMVLAVPPDSVEPLHRLCAADTGNDTWRSEAAKATSRFTRLAGRVHLDVYFLPGAFDDYTLPQKTITHHSAALN